MKILVTADLHYEIPRSRRPAAKLIRRICREGGDAVVLVGDTGGAKLEPLAEADDLVGLEPDPLVEADRDRVVASDLEIDLRTAGQAKETLGFLH